MEKIIVSLLILAMAAGMSAANETEMNRARSWSARYAQGVKADSGRGLTVIENYNDVYLNEMFLNYGKLTLGGKPFDTGLCCHADSRVVVKLDKPMTGFRFTAGLDDRAAEYGVIEMRVLAGDKVLWDGGKFGKIHGKTFEAADRKLSGEKEITLVVDKSDGNIAFDWADWADGEITLEDGEKVNIGSLDTTSACDLGEHFLSFDYGGEHSRDFLSGWDVKRSSKKAKDGTIRRFVKYTDPKTKLTVETEFTEYTDFPVIEYKTYFTNNGTENTPKISDIRPADLNLNGAVGSDVIIRHPAGSAFSAEDYKPIFDKVEKGKPLTVACTNGRPTETHAPYFNIDFGTRGVIAAMGWQGQWTSSFDLDASKILNFSAGQEKINTTLYPGEKISAPRIVLLFWDGGDLIDAQNKWRRWMMAYNTPKPGGKPVKPSWEGSSSFQYDNMQQADTESQKMFIERYLEEKIPIDYWWMDAGWYTYPEAWTDTGTWVVDTKRYPKGLGEISDFAHERGLKTILWFEPECVTPDTEIANEHPEWVYYGDLCRNFKPGNRREWLLLRLGDPKAKEWTQKRITDILDQNRIDVYRQDFRLDPIRYWSDEDEENRVGMNEIRHCEAYMDMWDAIAARRPNDFIDSCAAGGRRNEIDAMKRAIPLWRSDYALDPDGMQCQTYGISFWIPYHGTGVSTDNLYDFRSESVPMMRALYDMRNRDFNYEAVRKYAEQWKKTVNYMLCDYYPLTKYSTEKDCWMGWQFDSPEEGAGSVTLFRREESPFETAVFKLRGLDAAAKYVITDEDTGLRHIEKGEKLLTEGMRITLDKPRSAALFTYKKLE